MDLFSSAIKKYSLHFPHLPLPTIVEHDGFYNVFIFDIEVEINDPSDLDFLIDQVVDKMNVMYEERQKELENIKKVMSEEVIIKSDDKKTEQNNKRNRKRKNSVTIENNNPIKRLSEGNSSIGKINAKSARGKMKIKNIQSNRYVPTFSEDINENKNNILTEPTELFSEKVTNYCHIKNIAYPEYVFEKGNGVYLCRALFLKEKFESRYAYDMTAAKEDASSLIYSYIKFLESGTEDTKRKCTASIQNEASKPEAVRNTNYSDMFNNTDKDEKHIFENFFEPFN